MGFLYPEGALLWLAAIWVHSFYWRGSRITSTTSSICLHWSDGVLSLTARHDWHLNWTMWNLIHLYQGSQTGVISNFRRIKWSMTVLLWRDSSSNTCSSFSCCLFALNIRWSSTNSFWSFWCHLCLLHFIFVRKPILSKIFKGLICLSLNCLVCWI